MFPFSCPLRLGDDPENHIVKLGDGIDFTGHVQETSGGKG
jgi:hypothetical protein